MEDKEHIMVPKARKHSKQQKKRAQFKGLKNVFNHQNCRHQ